MKYANEDKMESIVAVIELIERAIEYITILGKNTQHDDPDTTPKDGIKTIDLLSLFEIPHNSNISITFNPINNARTIPIKVEKGIISPS